MKESGIEVLRGYTRDFEAIENKGWKIFIAHREDIVLLQVRKFYTNAKERDEDYVFV